jgi:hypothetical protein
MTMSMTQKVGIVIFLSPMIKQPKGETWICLVGVGFSMHVEGEIEEKPDGSVSFVRLVEYKDGRHRKERISTRKEHIVYTSETLETG